MVSALCEWVKEGIDNHQDKIHLGCNAAASGMAVFCLSGSLPITGVALVASAFFSKQKEEPPPFWFRWEGKTVENLQQYWKHSWPFYKIWAIVGIFSRVVLGPGGLSLPMLLVAATYRLARTLFYQLCVEISFRGLLMEGLKWACSYVEKNPKDPTTQKIVNIIQAIAYSLFQSIGTPYKGLSFFFFAYLGKNLGELKEEKEELVTPFASCIHGLSAVSLGTVLTFFPKISLG